MGLYGGACLDSKAGHERVERRIGLHLGHIEIQLLTLDQPGLLALLNHRIEEDRRVNGGTPLLGIVVVDQCAHEAKVEHAVQVAVEVVGGY